MNTEQERQDFQQSAQYFQSSEIQEKQKDEIMKGTSVDCEANQKIKKMIDKADSGNTNIQIFLKLHSVEKKLNENNRLLNMLIEKLQTRDSRQQKSLSSCINRFCPLLVAQLFDQAMNIHQKKVIAQLEEEFWNGIYIYTNWKNLKWRKAFLESIDIIDNAKISAGIINLALSAAFSTSAKERQQMNYCAHVLTEAFLDKKIRNGEKEWIQIKREKIYEKNLHHLIFKIPQCYLKPLKNESSFRVSSSITKANQSNNSNFNTQSEESSDSSDQQSQEEVGWLEKIKRFISFGNNSQMKYENTSKWDSRDREQREKLVKKHQE